ncbi:hypothetical protein EXE44_16710 [Halorubrum sp. SS7]|uniref:hypothetical protein n=1 Tax=unclassified Halorubrum TaxID=2642239 RepID=UPI0010F85262|nr:MULTISPECIES: hypothetical protein [unclassified Halorubrum]TKX53834.1 hypothetical protein EXE42_11135 [Halorubrum sp. SP3]TKX54871.1 hypothetical protein EXE44_16710 [Halorubrum sp. SS7]
MAPELSRRKTLHLSGAAVLTGLAGCSALSSGARPQIASSLGTTAYTPIIDQQPTPDGGVPAVWGMILAHPDAARKLIDWGALTPADDDSAPGTAFRTFDPGKQFMSVIVGVLPTGAGLMDYHEKGGNPVEDIVDDFTDRSVYQNGRLRYDVTSYQAFPPDPDTPEYHYDYSFTLWRLNGADRPTEITVDYHDA